MSRTDFDPASNGFAFVNSWTFDSTERATVVSLVQSSVKVVAAMLPMGFGQVADLAGVDDTIARWAASGLPDSYGLCGGMAFAALDYHRSDIPLPRGTGRDDIPARSTPEGAKLRSYLWQRLIDSLQPNVSKFLYWMAIQHLVPDRWPFDGGPEWLHARSVGEWAKLRKLIDANQPWPMGLVGTTNDPFSNHQVLATGYEPRPGGEGLIYVYDMNCPGAEQTIRVNLKTPPLTKSGWESCRSSARGPLRGFFVESYRARTPPRISYGTAVAEGTPPQSSRA